MTHYTRFETHLCEIIVAGDASGITHLHLNTGEGKRQFAIDPSWSQSATALSEACLQIREYMEGKRTRFTLPLNPMGTEFQKRVWNELSRIPFGGLRSYKEIAEALGKPGASRAVGSANGKNPIPLIIPCHRVIAANGRLAGFAHGLTIKRQLIDHEKGCMPCFILKG